jgi:hypothetical protein
VHEWVVDRDGRRLRSRKKRIPAREQALAVAAKARTESFEGSFLGRRRLQRHTVAELWKSYAPAAERDNDSWATDKGRAKHLLRHFGNMQADRLTLKEVDAYRDARLKEKTRRGTPPTPATLDREVELLKRPLGYAMKSAQLKDQPSEASSSSESRMSGGWCWTRYELGVAVRADARRTWIPSSLRQVGRATSRVREL